MPGRRERELYAEPQPRRPCLCHRHHPTQPPLHKARQVLQHHRAAGLSRMERREPLWSRTSASLVRVAGSDVSGRQFPWRWKMAPRSRQLSSTPLEILLFLNGWYYATYFLLEIFIFVYKGLLLPYPSANLALDLVMLFLYLGIEVTRIFFGSKGNLCQRKVPLSISLALTFPAAVMAAYYLLLQTYALRLEAILNAILLLFYAVELLLGILTLASFSRVDSY